MSPVDLADFLLARIAQDEAAARNRITPAPGSPFLPINDGAWFITVVTDSGSWRFDANRMLAECDAKRRIVTYANEQADYGLAHGATGHTLRLLALPYADHPDYREEWRP